jgi:hypothetical protein
MSPFFAFIGNDAKLPARGILIFFFLAAFIGGCNDKPEIEPQNNPIQVYPNPALDAAYVSFENAANARFTLVVFGVKGETVFERTEDIATPVYPIDLSKKPKGTYHVVLRKDNRTFIRQLLKI